MQRWYFYATIKETEQQLLVHRDRQTDRQTNSLPELGEKLRQNYKISGPFSNGSFYQWDLLSQQPDTYTSKHKALGLKPPSLLHVSSVSVFSAISYISRCKIVQLLPVLHGGTVVFCKVKSLRFVGVVENLSEAEGVSRDGPHHVPTAVICPAIWARRNPKPKQSTCTYT